MQIKMIFTYFSLINLSSPYEFVDIQCTNQQSKSWEWRKSVEFIEIRGPSEARPPRFDQNICPGSRYLAAFENLQGGMVTLGND